MCGIVGVYGYDHVVQDVYDGLLTLQHRGQDASGIITFDGKFHVQKDFGLINDVFHQDDMARMRGYVGIGHTRYATIGTGDPEEIQPFLGASPFGIVMAQNGNIFNSAELKKVVFEKYRRMVNSSSDGEVMLNILSKALSVRLWEEKADEIKPEYVWDAVKNLQDMCSGGYAIVTYIAKQGFLAFKDPHGIRPLVMGKRETEKGLEYIFASETVTLNVLGYEFFDDVGAGEAIFIDEKTRTVHRKKLSDYQPSPCVFEYVYFARPDSVLNGISVYKSRLRMGEKLAKQIKESGVEIDVVMPVPDSARGAALNVAEVLGVKYREGLVKNRYIGRTFIMPGQKKRQKSIRYKLNPMPLEIRNKKVLLVDDSIVRGNTSKQIVEMVRNAGAEKVYFASFSPPVKWPNLYGIDIPTRDELIGATHDFEGIREFIGCDELFYGTLEDMYQSCVEGNPKIKSLDMSCFDGVYVTGDIDEKVLAEQAASRSSERACAKIDS